MQYEFEAALWLWESRSDTWTFVTVPADPSAEITDLTAALPPRGFRSVRVEVGIGGSIWRTSMFPGSDGQWVLPVKKAVRRAEALDTGDVAQVRIEVIDL